MASLAVEQFADWRWRLNNLYSVMDKEGRKVRFTMNWAQAEFFDRLHYSNIILKARQLGFTTFLQLYMLDQVVFNSDVRAGVIAHTLGDAQTIFRDKLKFPYDNLPEGLRAARAIVKNSATELMLSNNSSVRVGTSLRSGTLQFLHISEYGKICARFPDKAREIRTGALNTVQAGQVVFIESTAEGQEGHFFELCQTAQTKARTGARLSPLDFRFHFFAWHRMPEYTLDPEGVTIDANLARYFDKLEAAHGLRLSAGQKAWYAKKLETQLGDMKREYPSTPEEAFEAAIEGAYYSEPIAVAEHQGRVGLFKAEPGFPVHTSWDIGHHDYTAIWFFQIIAGRLRIVGYFQNTGEGMPYYVGELGRMARENGWSYGHHYFPHDGRVVEWGSGRSRLEQAQEAGLSCRIQVAASLADGINAVRATLPLCVFDEAGTAQGVKMLKAYRKAWDDERGIWMDRPHHDWTSHGADAFRGLALTWREIAAEHVPTAADRARAEAARIAALTAPRTMDDVLGALDFHEED